MIAISYFFLLLFFGNFVLRNMFLAGVLGIFQNTRNNIKKRRQKTLSIIKELKTKRAGSMILRRFSKKYYNT